MPRSRSQVVPDVALQPVAASTADVRVSPPPRRRRAPVPVDARPVRAATADAGDMCAIRCIDAPTVTRVRAAMPAPAAVALAAERLRLLGDPTRLRLLAALARAEELCVCDLALILGAAVSQSAVSHSLRALRHLGLVTYRRAGKIAYYRLADAATARLMEDLFAGAVSEADSDSPAARRKA